MAVTVKEAIRKGQIEVNLISLIIYVLIIGCVFYLYKFESHSVWLFVASFFFALIPTWIYWSYNIVKWRLWAFKNVKNVHELKYKAIRHLLIWEDDSFYNKTEIWTKFQKSEWKNISKKFKQPDVYEDNKAIPPETVVKFSKNSLVFIIAFSLLFIASSVYYFLDKNYLFSFGFLFATGLLLYDNLKKINKTFIKINEKGIQTINTNFIPWSSIVHIEVQRKGYGSDSKDFLTIHSLVEDEDDEYNYEKLLIQDFSISAIKLDKLIRIYKQRFKKNDRTNNQ